MMLPENPPRPYIIHAYVHTSELPYFESIRELMQIKPSVTTSSTAPQNPLNVSNNTANLTFGMGNTAIAKQAHCRKPINII